MKNAIKKRIFAYWVNIEGVPFPEYIKFCLQTWYENIPDLEVVIINHYNINEWLPNFFDKIDKNVFINLTPVHQSDIVRFFVLYHHGGIYMDCDTLVTKDIFKEIEKFKTDKVYFFGTPNTEKMHVGMIISLEKHNRDILSIVEKQTFLLECLANFYPSRNLFPHLHWSTFANDIINNLFNDNLYKGTFEVLDRIETGCILENNLNSEDENLIFDLGDRERYIEFYFNQKNVDLTPYIEKIEFGVVCLHNSWTPAFYKNMSLEQIIKDDLLISQLIRHALGSKFLESAQV